VREEVWSVYLVRCGDDSLYTGVATDVARRFAEHVEGGARAAKYLRGRGPLRLVFAAEIGARGAALTCEYRVKRLSRARKEAIVSGRSLLPVSASEGVDGEADESS